VDDEKPIDAFDDLFEPFELEEQPTRQQQPAPRQPAGETPRNPAPTGGSACPSCGTVNPPFNRHCEACGARLSQVPLPVAPQPMLRTTAGARALMVLAGVILTVAILALAVNVFRRDGEAVPETTVVTATTTPPLDIIQLKPIRVDCTTELPSFPCSALTDDDPNNYWNAEGEEMIGAEIVFLFAPPVQITEMNIQNLEDEERFHRNARIDGIEVVIDDLPTATIEELADTSELQRISLRSLRTSQVRITITSAHPGETWNDNAPYPELAVQEIQFYGRVSPEIDGG